MDYSPVKLYINESFSPKKLTHDQKTATRKGGGSAF